jgi:hypothetical protein
MDTHGYYERAAAQSSSGDPGAILSVDEFSITRGTKRAGQHRLLRHGRDIMPVPADRVEAQYRFPDGSTLLLATCNRQFAETLSLVYLGADLAARDHLVVGRAYRAGYLAYAEIYGPASIAFCWDDHEQVVTIRPRRRRFGLRTRWLTLTERPAAIG